MTEQQRGRRAIETGPTGKTVRDNLARLRKLRGFTTRQLSAALERNGRPIPASGITRMEKGERQVTVDDLMALAVVFGVSPSALLLPLTDRPEDTIDVTGGGTVPADTAWDWADGQRPLNLPDGDTSTAMLEYALHSRPPRRRAPRGTYAAGERSAEELARQRRMYEALLAMGPEGRDIDAVREDMKRLDSEPWKGGDDGPRVD